MNKFLLISLALGLAWQLGAQPPFPPQGTPQGAPRQAPQQQTLIKAALPEYWANPTGKYAVAVDDQTLPEHTLFYPKDLASLKKNEKLPVFVMSGPGCDKTSSAFRAFFTEVASHPGWGRDALSRIFHRGIRSARVLLLRLLLQGA